MYLVLEGKGGRKKGRETSVYGCLSHTDLAHSPAMCPDWESNRWPFDSQAGTQSTEPHQPELITIIMYQIGRRDRNVLINCCLCFEIVIIWSRFTEVHVGVAGLLKAPPWALCGVTASVRVAVPGLHRTRRWHAGGCQSVHGHLPKIEQVSIFSSDFTNCMPGKQTTFLLLCWTHYLLSIIRRGEKKILNKLVVSL